MEPTTDYYEVTGNLLILIIVSLPQRAHSLLAPSTERSLVHFNASPRPSTPQVVSEKTRPLAVYQCLISVFCWQHHDPPWLVVNCGNPKTTPMKDG